MDLNLAEKFSKVKFNKNVEQNYRRIFSPENILVMSFELTFILEAQLKHLMLSIKKIVTILSLSDLHFNSV